MSPGIQNCGQLAFRFSSPSGIGWHEITNCRLAVDANGNGQIGPGETQTVGGTPRITFASRAGLQPTEGWRWITGETWSFTNWLSGRPDNSSGDWFSPQDRLLYWFNQSGTWDDSAGFGNAAFIVEFEPGGGSGGPTQPADAYHPVRNQSNNHWYAVVPDGMPWDEAQAFARSLTYNGWRGHLVTLNSSVENTWAQNNLDFYGQKVFWLGGYQDGDMIVTFQGPFPSLGGGTGGYILLADADQLALHDGVTVSVENPQLKTSAGVLIESVAKAARHVVGGVIALADPVVGQKADALLSQPNPANVALFGFRLDAKISQTVNQVDFNLSALNGLETGNFVSPALYVDTNANGLPDAGEPQIGGAAAVTVDTGAGTGRIRFAQPFQTGKSYLLLSSFTGLRAGDALTIGLNDHDIVASGGVDVFGDAQPARHVVDDPCLLSANPQWRPIEDFGVTAGQQGVPLFSFNLGPAGRDIRTLRLSLSGVAGIAGGDISGAALYRDKDGDGRAGAGDTALGTGVVSVSGSAGSILFGTAFSTSGSLLAAANFANLTQNDRLTISLPPQNVTPAQDHLVTGTLETVNYRVKWYLSDHPAGQKEDGLTGYPGQNDVDLFAFRIAGGGETVHSVRFTFDDLAGITSDKITSAALYVDQNNNGRVDAGEPRAGGEGQRLFPDSMDARTVFSDDFESGAFGANWTASCLPAAPGASVSVSSSGKYFGNYGAYLVRDTTGYCRLDLALDLSECRDALLTFDLKTLSGSISSVDGLYLSSDGAAFQKLNWSMPDYWAWEWDHGTIDLASEAARVGVLPGKNTVLRWQRYASSSSQRSAALDNVVVKAVVKTGHVTFSEPFATGDSYILRGNFRNLAAGDGCTVRLAAQDVALSTAGLLAGSTTPATHAVENPYRIYTSALWLPVSGFGAVSSQHNVPLLGFQLTPVNGGVNRLLFSLSNIAGIVERDLSNAALYRDANGNGRIDAGDQVVASSGAIHVEGNAGTILFNTSFASPGNLLLTADFDDLTANDQITIALSPENVGAPAGIYVTGSVLPVTYRVVGGAVPPANAKQDWTLSWRSPGGTAVNGRFNHAGDRVILGYDTGSAWIFDAASNTPLLMLKDHYDTLVYAGFTPDDSGAVTVARDGVVSVWNAQTGKMARGMFSDLQVTAAVPSPDSTRLLVLTNSKVMLLDIVEETTLWEFVQSGQTVRSIDYSPDGAYVVIGSSDTQAYLLDAVTGNVVQTYTGHFAPVTVVSFAAGGERLIASSPDGLLQLWDTLSGDTVATVQLDPALNLKALGSAVSPDGSRLAMVVETTVSPPTQYVRLYNTDGELLLSFPLSKAGVNWGGALGTIVFDDAANRLLITSTSGAGGWARVACFDARTGDFLRTWGPSGSFTASTAQRPRISSDGERLFYMTDRGLTLLFRSPGKKVLASPRLTSAKGYDVSPDGEKVVWFASGNLKVDGVAETGFTPLVDSPVGVSYDNIAVSPSGARVLAGDRMFSTLLTTGSLLANYAVNDGEYASAFSPDEMFWSFGVRGSAGNIVVLRTENLGIPPLYKQINTGTFQPDAVFFHPDGLRIACEDMSGQKVIQLYNIETREKQGLYDGFAAYTSAAISKDGSMLLVAINNTVRLIETRTGRNLRIFYPRNSSIANMKARAVSFARDDSEIMIAWNTNYVELYDRSQLTGLELRPGKRVLARGERQVFHVVALYDDGSRSDVTPRAGSKRNLAYLEVDPPTQGSVQGAEVRVADNAAATTFTVRARYLEGQAQVTAEASVGVGDSHLAQLIADPAAVTVTPGIFQSIRYMARYDDGYEAEVTTSVTLSADRAENVEISGQSVRVRFEAPPGEIAVTGAYTDAKGERKTAQTVVTVFGAKTSWEKWRVSSGGYGVSGAFSADGSKLALGSSSGAVSIYSVGAAISGYRLNSLFLAHQGQVKFVAWLSGGVLVFAPGQTHKTISIQVLDNRLDEPDKTVIVALSSPAGATLGTVSSHVFTIIDNDVSLVITPPVVNVPEGGTAWFDVKLTSAPQSNVAVFVAKWDSRSRLKVVSGSSLAFTPSNWNTNQKVTLGSDWDYDLVNSQAQFLLYGPNVRDTWLTVNEIDAGRVRVEGVSRSGYTTDTLQAGKAVYGDRSYVFSSPVPWMLEEQTYIRTLNNDKDVAAASFLSFDVNQPAVVYVALSEQIATPPAWLSAANGWARRSAQLVTTDSVPGRNLWMRSFGAGRITLGSNRDSAMPQGRSMYTVVLTPQLPPAGAGSWMLYE